MWLYLLLEDLSDPFHFILLLLLICFLYLLMPKRFKISFIYDFSYGFVMLFTLFYLLYSALSPIIFNSSQETNPSHVKESVTAIKSEMDLTTEEEKIIAEILSQSEKEMINDISPSEQSLKGLIDESLMPYINLATLLGLVHILEGNRKRARRLKAVKQNVENK